MRTRTFYTTLTLLTVGLLSGCSGTNALSSHSSTSNVALGAMESAEVLNPVITSGSPLCLSSGDDLGQSMWIWHVVLLNEQDDVLLVATDTE